MSICKDLLKSLKCTRPIQIMTLYVIYTTLANSMGVVERIKQIQEEEARKAAEAEVARMAEWKRTEPERLAALEAQKREEFIKKTAAREDY